MEIPDKYKQYFSGEKFSNGLLFKLTGAQKADSLRMDYLTRLVEGKNVLHIGFCDHLPLIEDKIRDDSWLHKRLIESSNKCVGVDVNKSAVEFCEEAFKISDIYHLNIIEDEPIPEIAEQNWDYAILGEILEHVNNPVEFLESLRTKYSGSIEKLVITVPNAWDLTNLIYLRHNTEFINSDHRYWFTPYTLSKVLTEAGYEVCDIEFVDSFTSGKFIHRFLRRKYCMLSENLVAISRLR